MAHSDRVRWEGYEKGQFSTNSKSPYLRKSSQREKTEDDDYYEVPFDWCQKGKINDHERPLITLLYTICLFLDPSKRKRPWDGAKRRFSAHLDCRPTRDSIINDLELPLYVKFLSSASVWLDSCVTFGGNSVKKNKDTWTLNLNLNIADAVSKPSSVLLFTAFHPISQSKQLCILFRHQTTVFFKIKTLIWQWHAF